MGGVTHVWVRAMIRGGLVGDTGKNKAFHLPNCVGSPDCDRGAGNRIEGDH